MTTALRAKPRWPCGRSSAPLVPTFSLCLAIAALARTGLSREDTGAAPTTRALAGTAVSERTSLGARSGVARLEAWLGGDTRTRRRAIERLASIDSARAREFLITALQQATDEEDRLLLVRALARHRDRTEARRALIQVVTGAPVSQAGALGELARETAALALAASGHASAWRALAKALHQEGPAARAAERALLAYPPDDIEPFLAGSVTYGERTIHLLGELGDQRFFHTLRDRIRHAAPPVRASALIALTRLGALETVPVAEHWWRHEKSRALRLAAAEVLTLTRAPGATAAVATLLATPSLRRTGLELLANSPDPKLVPNLAKLLDESEEDSVEILGLIGRAGGPEALRHLSNLARVPRYRSAAVYALARFDGAAADRELRGWLDVDSMRRWAVRAVLVRAALSGKTAEGLPRALVALSRSTHAPDRAVAEWAFSVAERPLVEALSRRVAEASTLELERILETGAAGRFLAALALAARTRDERRLSELLESGDPLFRAHVAFGLGTNGGVGSVALLETLYRFEGHANVRRAVLRALSLREERSRERVLRLAQELDPDPEARELARLALFGRKLPALVRGNEVVWARLRPAGAPNARGREAAPTTADSRSGIAGREVVVVTSTGLAFPARSDPDGLVVLTGLPPGPVEVRVEPELEERASRPNRRERPKTIGRPRRREEHKRR